MTQRHPTGRPRLLLGAAGAGSLSAAARELGITHAGREQAPGADGSATRRVAGQPDHAAHEPDARGRDCTCEHARRILGEIDGMEELLGVAKATPKGLLRVNATLGFGRSHVAPLISRFVRKYPQVDVQLQLSVNPPPLTEDSFDVCIRFGAPPDARVIARQHRVEPAAAVRLARVPGEARRCRKVPNDLTQAQLHRHPAGRGGLRRLAPGQRPRQERRSRGGEDRAAT